jgi:signal transduction histidine kinase
VTSVVRLQDAARRNEAMAAMGALVAGVAHEVRNPLFSMSATLDALEARQGAGAGGRHMEILHGQLDRLQQLMGELLDYGRPPALATADVGFDAVARQAVDEGAALARERGVELVADVPAGLPRIRADQARLAQVYVNLITNAIHYSPQGARVVVRARLAGENGSQWLETVVEDAGRGFPAEDLPRIFEPFFSRRPGGTGLGLALVQRIVEQHGGSVTAGNRPEGGAAVVVRLPLAGAQVAQG